MRKRNVLVHPVHQGKIGVQLEFELVDSLPPLSWCARVAEGGAISVRHGKWVETRADRFVEGAWDGEFDLLDFDMARNLAGSGGVLRGRVCVFAAPYHPLEQLFVMRDRSGILVSNSLAFLLQTAGDAPDLRHPRYFFDLLRYFRRGIGRQPAILPMASGRRVEMYTHCRLSIDANLKSSWSMAPAGPAPDTYGEYFDQLLSASRLIVRNAAAPGRKMTYEPVAACSRGYDSVASAALASRAGCKAGVTFRFSGQTLGHPILGSKRVKANDSGADTLRALGMTVTEFDRERITEIAGFPAAEFFYNVSGAYASPCVMEEKLAGTVFFQGRHGERYWDLNKACARQNFSEYDDYNLIGHGETEFRLRVGYVNLPIPYIGALHGPAIYRLSHSDEMRPWRFVTGGYDRPIARRLAEEAGVPRENFGQEKVGGGYGLIGGLNARSQQDFTDFFENAVPVAIRKKLRLSIPEPRPRNHRRLVDLRYRHGYRPMVTWALDSLGADRFHRDWNSAYLYGFHWGFEKIRARYST